MPTRGRCSLWFVPATWNIISGSHDAERGLTCCYDIHSSHNTLPDAIHLARPLLTRNATLTQDCALLFSTLPTPHINGIPRHDSTFATVFPFLMQPLPFTPPCGTRVPIFHILPLSRHRRLTDMTNNHRGMFDAAHFFAQSIARITCFCTDRRQRLAG